MFVLTLDYFYNAELIVMPKTLSGKIPNSIYKKYSRQNSLFKVIAERQHYTLSYFVGSLKSGSRSEV